MFLNTLLWYTKFFSWGERYKECNFCKICVFNLLNVIVNLIITVFAWIMWQFTYFIWLNKSKSIRSPFRCVFRRAYNILLWKRHNSVNIYVIKVCDFFFFFFWILLINGLSLAANITLWHRQQHTHRRHKVLRNPLQIFLFMLKN